MLTIRGLHSDARGFTMVELLVATMVTMLVLGGAVTLTSQVQQGYRRQLEDAAAEQEGRFALDWVSRLIRSAANNPYNIAVSDCPAAATPFSGLIVAAPVNGIHTEVRLQTDSNPPDRLIGGTLNNCDQPNEDVRVWYDAGTRTIRFDDMNLAGNGDMRTEAVIEGLQFIFRDSTRTVIADPVTNAASVIYVETRVTVRPRQTGVNMGNALTRTLSQEVRIRGRNY